MMHFEFEVNGGFDEILESKFKSYVGNKVSVQTTLRYLYTHSTSGTAGDARHKYILSSPYHEDIVAVLMFAGALNYGNDIALVPIHKAEMNARFDKERQLSQIALVINFLMDANKKVPQYWIDKHEELRAELDSMKKQYQIQL